MVVDLRPPRRPLPRGGRTWSWPARTGAGPWRWCRVYHRGHHTPTGHAARTFGPLNRFDPHRPDAGGRPQPDPDARSVLYVGSDLATSLCEVFGAAGHAAICPRWRVAVLSPTTPVRLFDLARPGAAMAVGALPALADGPVPRVLSQQWARAVYEDQPARSPVTGIRYRSAYNGGISLALWDCDGVVDTVTDPTGYPADVAVLDPALLVRFRVAATARRITVDTVDAADCPDCRRDP